MDYTLALDTSGNYLVVILANNLEIITSIFVESDKKQSEYLIPSIDEVMKQAKITFADLKKILVCDGPGSYTGVRIGLSVAKVISYLQKIDLFHINILQAIAGDRTIISAVKARQDLYYSAIVKDGEIKEEGLRTLPELHFFSQQNEMELVIGHDQEFVKHFIESLKYSQKASPISLLPRYYGQY